MFYIEPTLGEGQFDTAIIHVGINDLLNNTAGTDVLLQNILKCSNTHKVLSDMIANLNLDISNICKSNRFHFIDNNNISMNLLYQDGLQLLYSGKELLAKSFYFNINNFL